jgi:antitoxin VapB
MLTTKVFKSGSTIMLFPKNDAWEQFKKSLDGFSDDFFSDGRNQPLPQERDFYFPEPEEE